MHTWRSNACQIVLVENNIFQQTLKNQVMQLKLFMWITSAL